MTTTPDPAILAEVAADFVARDRAELRAEVEALLDGVIDEIGPLNDGDMFTFEIPGRDGAELHYAGIKSGGRYFLTGRKPHPTDLIGMAGHLVMLGVTAETIHTFTLEDTIS